MRLMNSNSVSYANIDSNAGFKLDEKTAKKLSVVPNIQDLYRQMDYSHLLPPQWRQTVSFWLQEDIPSFDYGGFVVGEQAEVAEILCKSSGVLCGCPFVTEIFESLKCTIEWLVTEGEWIEVTPEVPRVLVAKIRGPARMILIGERTALNLMARASGIASLSRRARQIADKQGFKGVIAGTRKTTPGFRLVEKYSLIVGGSDTHRYDLSSMVMLKDNHVNSTGSITQAVKKAKSVAGFSIKIEVECQNVEEATEAIKAGADIVMLDNFKPEQLRRSAKSLKSDFPNIIIEASGGVTLDTLAEYCCEDVNVISMGGLTQSVPHIDFSLNINRKV